MTGYELYSFYRQLVGWKATTLDNYLESKEFNFYESLKDFFVKIKKLNDDDIYDYIKLIYNKKLNTFSPYELMDNDIYELFENWKKTKSTKSLYHEEVVKSFLFIRNFCINKSVSFENYKIKYAIKHIREEKIDFCVAAYLKLIDKRKLKKIEKIILQKYLSQYNILMQRIDNNPELNTLLKSSFEDMSIILKEISLLELNKPSTSSTQK